MNIEEERFAMAHNATEDYQVQKLLHMEMLEKCKGSAGSGMTDVEQLCCTCLHTAEAEGPDYQGGEISETLREIRRLRLEQESGMDMNYRCIRCRDCSACKDADRTEERDYLSTNYDQA